MPCCVTSGTRRRDIDSRAADTDPVKLRSNVYVMRKHHAVFQARVSSCWASHARTILLVRGTVLAVWVHED